MQDEFTCVNNIKPDYQICEIGLFYFLNPYQTNWSCAGGEPGLSADGVSVGRVHFCLALNLLRVQIAVFGGVALEELLPRRLSVLYLCQGVC